MRDPLYGFVSLSDLEIQVVDSDFFRRLLSLKQLSHAYIVYPTAIHTRFEHSLGVVHVADQMAQKLELLDEDIEIVRLAALLHDVGHGPFSHLFEHTMSKINLEQEDPHEKISQIIINEDPELNRILDGKKDSIVKILKGVSDDTDSTIKLRSSIVSGSLDADKLDYLRRDSYHIGVTYGQFDLPRILHTLTTTKHSSGVLVDITGKDALESYRLARYLMHIQVYEHHARLAADSMFDLALDIAVHEENVIEPSLLKFNTSGNNSEFLQTYKSLDDYSIYYKILESKKSRTSKEILRNIKRRKLLKRACEFTLDDLRDNADVEGKLLKMSSDEFKAMSSRIAESLKIPHHEVIFHHSAIKIKLYKRGDLLLKDGAKVLDLSSVSPIVAKDSAVAKYYVYGPEDKEIRKKIAEKTADELGMPLDKIYYK